MGRWRTRLAEVLDAASVPTADDLDGEPVVDRVRPQHVQHPCALSAFSADGDRVDGDGNFVECPATGTREVALVALGRAQDSGRLEDIDPRAAVAGVLADPDALRASLAAWVRGADRAALGCLSARACAWIADARAIASRRQGDPEWQPPASNAHRLGDRGVYLSAQVDAVRRSADARHLLVVLARPGARGDRLARRIALLEALVGGRIVDSVVCGHRSTLGREQLAVDDEVLEVACWEAARDVTHAQRPSTAEPESGSHCRWCSLLGECPTGQAELESRVRLPFPAMRPGARRAQLREPGDATM